jgi:hypothetical protein
VNHPAFFRAVRIALLGATALLCACSQPSVTLKNPDSGEVVACKGGELAGGMASRGVVNDLMTRCVDNYTNRGYEIVGSTQS